MYSRLFFSLAQIFAERGGKFLWIGFSHMRTIPAPALTRPHAFFIGPDYSEPVLP
jgi:hypothetical protein